MSNDILDAITNRKSIRKYQEKDVNSVYVNKLLNAGFCAPSANNKRPAEFIVIDDDVLKYKLSLINPYSKMVPNAPITIVVCGNTDIQSNMTFLQNDCSASIQNILLAAHGLGLGAVWVGVDDVANKEWFDHVVETLQLPKHIRPIALIPVGFPDQIRDVKDRFEDHKVHTNTYSK